jgi:hypothetical protein
MQVDTGSFRALTSELEALRREHAALGSLTADMASLRDALRQDTEQRAQEMLAVNAIYDSGLRDGRDEVLGGRTARRPARHRQRPGYLHAVGSDGTGAR